MRTLAVLVALAALAPAPPAGAAPPAATAPSVLDGADLEAEVSAALVWVGFPTVGVRYAAGGSGPVDLGGALVVDYHRGTIEPAFATRWHLWSQGGIAVAAALDLGLEANAGLTWADEANRPGVGLRLAPGLRASWRSHPSWAALASFEVPLLWTFAGGDGLRLPMLLGAGVEYALGPDVGFALVGRLGPRFQHGDGHTDGWFVHGELFGGLTFRLF